MCFDSSILVMRIFMSLTNEILKYHFVMLYSLRSLAAKLLLRFTLCFGARVKLQVTVGFRASKVEIFTSRTD